MEVSLATLLVAGALLAHAREHAWTTAGLAALAVLARPEALLLMPFLAASPPLRWRRVALFVAAAVLVLAPAVAFSIATVGAPIPATAAAKVEGGLLGWMTGVSESPLRLLLHRPVEFFRAWAAWLATTHWLLPWALVPAIIAVWRRRRPLGVAALVLAAHPLGMAMLAPYRDPAFQEGRYSTHLLPLAFVALAVAAASLSRSWRRVALATWGVLALVSFAPAADRYAWGVQNINAMQVHLGRWVDAHLPESSVLAVNDIGAIAYFSRRPVVDLMGLVTPEIIPYRRQGETGVMRYVARRCPDYVIVFPAWFPRMIEQPSFEPIYGVRLDRNEVSGAAEMIVYRLTRCTVSAMRQEDR
jgi:hypothetical protein